MFAAGTNNQLGFREVKSSTGYLAQDDPVVHFGLGAHTVVDLRVTYLDGTVVSVHDVDSRRKLILKGSTVLAPPQAPQALTAGVLGTQVSFNWGSPAGGGAISQYVLEAGTAPGLSNLASIALGNRTSFAVNAPAGVYYVRVRATNYAGASAASNEVVVPLGGACSAAPSAPSSFSAQVSGLRVTFNWVGVSSEPTTAFVLEVGAGPGLADLTAFQTTDTSFSAVGPPGRYYTRINARNACGLSPPSNEVVVQLGCQSAPSSPTGLSATVNGSAVTLNWSAGAGEAVDRYILEVGLAPGATNFVIDTQNPATALSASAPAGTYYVRVRGRNSCGTSGVSNQVQVVVN